MMLGFKSPFDEAVKVWNEADEAVMRERAMDFAIRSLSAAKDNDVVAHAKAILAFLKGM